MSERVTMPALGESVTEGTVTRWLKSVGDTIEVDEPLLEVSTDKVDTEIPSPVAGTLQEILVGEDDTVPVGADLAVIGDGSGGGSEQPSSSDAVRRQEQEQAAGRAERRAGPSSPSPSPASSAQAADGAAPRGRHLRRLLGAGPTVTMPALGESVTEGTVTRWLKAEGDQVEVDEPLLEVSTDKVDTEIPSPVAGTSARSSSGRTRRCRWAPTSPSSAAPAAGPRRQPQQEQEQAPQQAAGSPGLGRRAGRHEPPGRGRRARSRPPSSPCRRRSRAARHPPPRTPRRSRTPPRHSSRADRSPHRTAVRSGFCRRGRLRLGRWRRGRRRGLRHPAGAQARGGAQRRPRLAQGHRCRRPHPQAGRPRRRRGSPARRRAHPRRRPRRPRRLPRPAAPPSTPALSRPSAAPPRR